MQRAEHLVDAAFADEMQGHIDNANHKLRALQNAAVAKSGKRIKSAQQAYLRSFSAKLCSLVLAVKRDDNLHLTSLGLSDLASALEAFSDCGEPVQAYAKSKSIRGDWRPICKFGPLRKALQTMVSQLLSAKFAVEPIDYMAAGRGAEKASDRICELIDGGADYFVVADIASCFGSVKHEGVSQRLGLPPAVVHHCLLIGEDVTLTHPSALPIDTTHEAFSETVRRGLPQGALSSSRVASLLLGPELRSLTSDDRIVLYGDDFAIPAATRLEAETFAKILPGFLGAHPAGPFRLKCCNVHDARMGFNFLKYKFRRDQITGKSKLRPSTLSYHRFAERVRTKLSAKSASTGYKAIINYKNYWQKSFRRYSFSKPAEKLLGITVIYQLPPPLLVKWRASCEHYKKGHIIPPGWEIDWNVN